MYQIKIFTSSNPSEVEKQANEWLEDQSRRNGFRVVQVVPTDVVQITSDSGMQRFSLVVVFEM